MGISLTELDRRLKVFRSSYCWDSGEENRLDFIAEMCWALGLEPTIALRPGTRTMLAEDIGLGAPDAHKEKQDG